MQQATLALHRCLHTSSPKAAIIHGFSKVTLDVPIPASAKELLSLEQANPSQESE